MKYTCLILVILCVMAFKEENDMPIIIDKDINQFLQQYQTSLFFYYTPQCGHCEKFQPEVEKAAKILKEEGIPFAKVDGHNYKDIAKRFEVSGFPSVVLALNNGARFVKFEGTRTAESIILWMFEQINPGSKEVESIDAIKDTLEQSQIVFLYMAEDSEDRGFRRYKEFSHTYGQVVFIHTFIKDVQQELGLSKNDNLVCFKKFDKSPVVFEPKQIKISELKAFIENNIYPKLVKYNEELKKKVFRKDRNALILRVDETQIKDKNAMDALMNVALDYPSEEQLLFISISPYNTLYNEYIDQIGDYTSTPSLIGIQKSGIFKYKFNKSFTKQNLEQFISDFKANKALRHYKSQKIDSPNKYNNLTILTGNQYITNGDWVVLYYNSLNSDHNDVFQEYSDIAKQLSSVSPITFGIADVSKNEFSDFGDPNDIVKIRVYRSPSDFVRFTLKANKIQNERLINFIKENVNYEFEEQTNNRRHDDL